MAGGALDTENLSCFITVAANRSFTKAADLLYLSQPTVSRRVGRLEEELGYRLIDRGASDFALTRAGELVYKEGGKIIESIAALGANLRRIDCDITGPVSIGFYGLFHYLKILDAFKGQIGRNYPYIQLSVYWNLLRHLNEDIAAGRADVVVASRCELPQGPGIVCRSLIARHAVVLAPRSHSLANRLRLSVADLRDEPIVFWQEAICPGFYRSFVDACARAGFAPNLVERHEREEDIVMSVHMGRGLTVLFDKSNVEIDKSLAEIPLTDADMPVDVAYAYRIDNVNGALSVVVESLAAIVPQVSD